MVTIKPLARRLWRHFKRRAILRSSRTSSRKDSRPGSLTNSTTPPEETGSRGKIQTSASGSPSSMTRASYASTPESSIQFPDGPTRSWPGWHSISIRLRRWGLSQTETIFITTTSWRRAAVRFPPARPVSTTV